MHILRSIALVLGTFLWRIFLFHYTSFALLVYCESARLYITHLRGASPDSWSIGYPFQEPSQDPFQETCQGKTFQGALHYVTMGQGCKLDRGKSTYLHLKKITTKQNYDKAKLRQKIYIHGKKQKQNTREKKKSNERNTKQKLVCLWTILGLKRWCMFSMSEYYPSPSCTTT